MDLKLELLPVPVTDVDRAGLHERCGFVVDLDHSPNDSTASCS
jgi:hypothetical protein